MSNALALVRIEQEKRRRTGGRAPVVVWQPNPGPQTLAFASDADIIGYGGRPGGGKTDLLLGLAGTQHRRAVIFRREFPRVRAIIERSRDIFAANPTDHARDSYNEQLHLWRLSGGRTIEFASMQREEHKKNYQGRAYDFHGFDEATEFTESQVRFVIGWNRTTLPGQRTRVVLTFNPPLDDTGMWVVRFFAPWIDPEYAGQRAQPGEVRWFISTDDGDQEVSADGLVRCVPQGNAYRLATDDEIESELLTLPGTVIEDKVYPARSRTFIPARLEDNPDLLASGYGATLAALPAEVRAVLLGDFANVGKVSDPWQVIPTAWIKAAQARWQPQPSHPLLAVGEDVARGGRDRTTVARWYGPHLAAIQAVPGTQTPDGSSAAALVLQDALSGAAVGVDVIGVGASCYDTLRGAGVRVAGYNAAEGAPDARDRSGRLRFRNVRAASYWKLREALDPEHGENLALPPDPELEAELRAARYEITPGGILLESKDDITARLGRSPDKADAVVIGYWQIGRSRLLFGLV